MFHRDELHGFARALQCAQHHIALLERNHGVVAAVNQEHWHGHGAHMFDGRNFDERGIVLIGSAHESIPIALTPAEVIFNGPFAKASQVRNAGHRYGAAIYAGIQSHAGKRRIAAVAASDDAHACKVDHALLGEIAHPVG